MRTLLVVAALLVLLPASTGTGAGPSFDNARAEFGRLLRSGEPAERIRGVYALDGFDNAEAARLLIRFVLTREDRAGVIKAAQKLLGAMESPEAIRVMVDEAGKGTWLKRARLLESMGRVEGADACDVLLGAAYDTDPRVRTSAVLALERSASERADLAIGDALRAGEWPVRAAAIDVLRRRKPEGATGLLIDRLPAERGRLRGDLASALRSLTEQDLGVFPQAWEAWRRKQEGGTPIPVGAGEPVTPTALLAGVPTWAERVIFVLAVNDSMRKELNATPDQVVPPDVKEKGGEELRRWRSAKTKIELARLWVAWAIEHLAPGTRFEVITYAESADGVFGDLVPATPDNQRKAIGRTESLSPSGHANLHGALQAVYRAVSRDPLDLKSLSDGPETVFFVADGTADHGEIPEGYGATAEAEMLNRFRQIRFLCFGIGEFDGRVLGDLAGIGNGVLIGLP